MSDRHCSQILFLRGLFFSAATHESQALTVKPKFDASTATAIEILSNPSVSWRYKFVYFTAIFFELERERERERVERDERTKQELNISMCRSETSEIGSLVFNRLFKVLSSDAPNALKNLTNNGLGESK
jgi:hypothetical protein